jgi:hypothetical protein
MNIIAPDDYTTRLDQYIKDAFKNELKPSHPCEHQNKNCLKGSSCPLIGLPNDICTYHIRGGCKYNDNPEKCKHKHNERYANVYQSAKQEFRMAEQRPLALIRRYLRVSSPYIMWFFGIFFSMIVKRILDSFTNKLF